MVRIRLRRMGKTKRPTYRIVVADQRSPRDGRFIEIVGHYDPVRQPKVLEIKHDRVRYWIGVGAQPSESAMKLLKQVGLVDEAGNLVPAEAPPATSDAPAEAPPATSDAPTDAPTADPAETAAAAAVS